MAPRGLLVRVVAVEPSAVAVEPAAVAVEPAAVGRVFRVRAVPESGAHPQEPDAHALEVTAAGGVAVRALLAAFAAGQGEQGARWGASITAWTIQPRAGGARVVVTAAEAVDFRELPPPAAAAAAAAPVPVGVAAAAGSGSAKRAEAERRRLALQRNMQQARLDPSWRDWAGGLPVEVLAKVAKSLVTTETRGHGQTLLAVTCEGWRTGLDIAKAQARGSWRDWAGGMPADVLAKVWQTLKHDGRGLFVSAGVCTGWRDVQRRLGGPLRARVHSDVILPGRVALVKWALAHAGCPREKKNGDTLARAAALSGHLELVQWLCGEGGFKMDERVMSGAARGGNLELVQWLRGEGWPWDHWTCYHAAWNGHLEVLRWARESGCRMEKWTCFAAARSGRQGVLRWARENGAPWDAHTEDLARERFGYTDTFGNLVL